MQNCPFQNNRLYIILLDYNYWCISVYITFLLQLVNMRLILLTLYKVIVHTKKWKFSHYLLIQHYMPKLFKDFNHFYSNLRLYYSHLSTFLWPFSSSSGTGNTPAKQQQNICWNISAMQIMIQRPGSPDKMLCSSNLFLLLHYNNCFLC